jgi:hypothetical protein
MRLTPDLSVELFKFPARKLYLAELIRSLCAWRDARQAIFDAQDGVTPALFAALAEAEHQLMRLISKEDWE